jgi:hypothetical protein
MRSALSEMNCKRWTTFDRGNGALLLTTDQKSLTFGSAEIPCRMG